MNRRNISLAFGMNLVLGGLAVVSFGSGWYASWEGLTELGLHKWSSVALFAGIVIHATLHYRNMVRWRRRR